jgi:sec-independent protein translocase protein TatB
VFDIGFSEILLIFGLALIVLGPEKLPRVASQVGRWIGRARGMARQFREQLEEEVNLEEARKSRPPAITPPAPAVAEPPSPEGTLPAAIEPSAASASLGDLAAAAAQTPAEPAPSYPDHYSHAHPTDSEGLPLPAPDTAAPITSDAPKPAAQAQQPQYPNGYSHAHPTDSQGRPLPSSTHEPPATGSGQHDWIGRSAGGAGSAGDGGVTPTDKPAQDTTAAGYAPPHERGT